MQRVSFLVGTWLSLVEHSLGVRGVGSSNLPVPTNSTHSFSDEPYRVPPRPANQEEYFDPKCDSTTILESVTRVLPFGCAALVEDLSRMQLRKSTLGGILMSGQVILYFEDQADALRFALAAGSVMAGDGTRATEDLVQETGRVSRIRLDAANAGKMKKPTPERAA
jgi:hypothetical protein